MDNKKKILLLAVLGGAGYFAYKKFFKKQEEVEDKPTPLDVGKPTPVSPYVAPQVSPTPVVQESPKPEVGLPNSDQYQKSKWTKAREVYNANKSGTPLPTWTTLSPTSNFSNSAQPLNVTATGGNAANYYATMNGVRSRRKRKPKYCI